jgi:hypothetical protein
MIGRVAAAGFFLLAAIAPAAADPESEGLIRNFIAWVDSSNEWNASASIVRSDGDNTFAEGVVFSRDEPHVSVSIETLRLKDLTTRDGGGFTSSEIEVSGAAVAADAVQVSVPSGTLSNMSMPSLEGVTLDLKHLMTTFARFYTIASGATLDELNIPEMSVTQRHEPMGADQPTELHAAYRNLSMTGLANGVLAHQQLGPMSMSSQGPAGEKFDFGIEKLQADRFDLGALAYILDAGQYHDGKGDNIWRPLVSRFAYSGITASGGHGGMFRANEIAIENIDGRQPEKPFTDTWDRLIDPEVPQESKTDLALDAMTSLFAAWRVGTLRADGISADAQKYNVSLALASATLTGWSNAGFDSFLLDKLNGSSPDGFLSLGKMEVAGFIAPDLKALTQFAALEKNLDIEKHAAAIKKTFAALPRLAHFGLHDVSAGKSEADAGSLGDLTVDFHDWNAIWASATDIRIDGLSIPRRLLELDPQTTEIFDTLGYDDLAMSMSVADRWNPDAGSDDATWTFGMKDAVDVEVSYSLTGLTLDWLMRATAAAGASEDSQAAIMAMLNDIRLASLKVAVTDRSLLDRAFGVAATKQGLNVAGPAYREQMRAALPFLISAAVPADIAKLITRPVQEFLAGGQTIHADAVPPTPLSIPDLMGAAANPMGLPGILNLTLKSEAPAQ